QIRSLFETTRLVSPWRFDGLPTRNRRVRILLPPAGSHTKPDHPDGSRWPGRRAAVSISLTAASFLTGERQSRPDEPPSSGMMSEAVEGGDRLANGHRTA